MAPVSKKRAVRPTGINPVAIALLGTALAIYLFLILRYNFTQDDAYISFRYAANYLDGQGLVYNSGERIEGYTNFLWTILLILGRLAGLPFELFSKILGGLFGAGTILLAYRLAYAALVGISARWRSALAGICCILLAASYSFAYWTIAGLETAAFTFMVLAALYGYFTGSGILIPSLVLATLLRPEGGLVFIFVMAYEIITNRRMTTFAWQIGILYLVFLAPLAAFKLTYYGSLLPNPFYAKTSFAISQVINGAEYAGQYFWHYLGAGLFFIPVLYYAWKKASQVRFLMAFILLYLVYIVFVGGDVLKVHRFFVPIFPAVIISMVYGLQQLFKRKLFSLGALAVVLAWQLVVPYRHVTTFLELEKGLNSKMGKMAAALTSADHSNFSIALSTIGMVGYQLMGHTVIDMLGLTDSTIARHPEPPVEGMETTWRESHFNSPYLLSRRPDYILFSTGLKPSAPAERALYLYSAFLSAYRTIGFNFGTPTVHPIYKRYGVIGDDIRRDVDVRFVQNFNRGINLARTKDTAALRQALEAYTTALQYSPEPKYPYVYYYMSLAQRDMGDMDASFKSLLLAARKDNYVYEAFKDLYVYEYWRQNYKSAEMFRAATARLVPWYMPRLDSLARAGR